MRTANRWDIFCRVVDHFGDVGVSWRLARQLVHEQGRCVRLWIDDLKSLKCVVPDAALVDRQLIDGVEVHRWSAADLSDVTPADVVIDAFGCGIPPSYAKALARGKRESLWIVLEYLSAERWIRDCHGRPSPHPKLGVERYFFFPGFVEGTGGLLREKDIFERHDAFAITERQALWQSLGHEPARTEAFTAFVFAYEHAPLRELLQCWERGSRQAVAVVPESGLVPLVLGHFGVATLPASRVLRRRMLEVRVIPFVPQIRFDELLWSCDFNFVRGEDSFVRAQWAGSPFVWQAYPQAGGAQIAKIDAFLALYCRGLSEDARQEVGAMMRFWNRVDVVDDAADRMWAAFESHDVELRRHALQWRAEIAEVGSLADNLASFCEDKLK
jgi:uncharacterized repeat protein (TIGR03837 family)